MKLTFWVACSTDRSDLNLRAATKKACKALVASSMFPENYDKPFRAEFEYSSGLDLYNRTKSGEIDDTPAAELVAPVGTAAPPLGDPGDLTEDVVDLNATE